MEQEEEIIEKESKKFTLTVRMILASVTLATMVLGGIWGVSNRANSPTIPAAFIERVHGSQSRIGVLETEVKNTKEKVKDIKTEIKENRKYLIQILKRLK